MRLEIIRARLRPKSRRDAAKIANRFNGGYAGFHAIVAARSESSITFWSKSASTVARLLDRPFALRDSARVTIDLARDVEAFLQEQIRAGVCSNPSELVNDVLRSLREQQQKPFQVTPQLEAWLLEAADSPTTPLQHEDFEAIRQRVRGGDQSKPS
jgi:Arc/MetJ-type ribon-helix-helix transcriptional regulator